jgi:hypothetical protein
MPPAHDPPTASQTPRLHEAGHSQQGPCDVCQVWLEADETAEHAGRQDQEEWSQRCVEPSTESMDGPEQRDEVQEIARNQRHPAGAKPSQEGPRRGVEAPRPGAHVHVPAQVPYIEVTEGMPQVVGVPNMQVLVLEPVWEWVFATPPHQEAGE